MHRTIRAYRTDPKSGQPADCSVDDDHGEKSGIRIPTRSTWDSSELHPGGLSSLYFCSISVRYLITSGHHFGLRLRAEFAGGNKWRTAAT